MPAPNHPSRVDNSAYNDMIDRAMSLGVLMGEEVNFAGMGVVAASAINRGQSANPYSHNRAQSSRLGDVFAAPQSGRALVNNILNDLNGISGLPRSPSARAYSTTMDIPKQTHDAFVATKAAIEHEILGTPIPDNLKDRYDKASKALDVAKAARAMGIDLGFGITNYGTPSKAGKAGVGPRGVRFGGHVMGPFAKGAHRPSQKEIAARVAAVAQIAGIPLTPQMQKEIESVTGRKGKSITRATPEDIAAAKAALEQLPSVQQYGRTVTARSRAPVDTPVEKNLADMVASRAAAPPTYDTPREMNLAAMEATRAPPDVSMAKAYDKQPDYTQQVQDALTRDVSMARAYDPVERSLMQGYDLPDWSARDLGLPAPPTGPRTLADLDPAVTGALYDSSVPPDPVAAPPRDVSMGSFYDTPAVPSVGTVPFGGTGYPGGTGFGPANIPGPSFGLPDIGVAPGTAPPAGPVAAPTRDVSTGSFYGAETPSFSLAELSAGIAGPPAGRGYHTGTDLGPAAAGYNYGRSLGEIALDQRARDLAPPDASLVGAYEHAASGRPAPASGLYPGSPFTGMDINVGYPAERNPVQAQYAGARRDQVEAPQRGFAAPARDIGTGWAYDTPAAPAPPSFGIGDVGFGRGPVTDPYGFTSADVSGAFGGTGKMSAQPPTSTGALSPTPYGGGQTFGGNVGYQSAVGYPSDRFGGPNPTLGPSLSALGIGTIGGPPHAVAADYTSAPIAGIAVSLGPQAQAAAARQDQREAPERGITGYTTTTETRTRDVPNPAFAEWSAEYAPDRPNAVQDQYAGALSDKLGVQRGAFSEMQGPPAPARTISETYTVDNRSPVYGNVPNAPHTATPPTAYTAGYTGAPMSLAGMFGAPAATAYSGRGTGMLGLGPTFGGSWADAISRGYGDAVAGMGGGGWASPSGYTGGQAGGSIASGGGGYSPGYSGGSFGDAGYGSDARSGRDGADQGPQ